MVGLAGQAFSMHNRIDLFEFDLFSLILTRLRSHLMQSDII